MPSTKLPTTVSVGSGPKLAADVLEQAQANLLAHVTDPLGAHPGSAISYDGGPAWADTTANPATDVDSQLDKIVTDLSTGDGAGKIRYDGGGAWQDGTTNPARTLNVQIDDMITQLSGTTTGASNLGGVELLGSEAITNTTVTVASGTLRSQLETISLASGVQYAGGGNWQDGETNPATDVEAQLDKIIADLTNTGAGTSGAAKTGVEASTVGAVTLNAGRLLVRLQELQDAANINIVAGPAWLGGRANPQEALQTRIDSIINDLGDTAAGDDGSERIGAEEYVGTYVTAPSGSVRSQLNAILDELGGVTKQNTWLDDQTISGSLILDQTATIVPEIDNTSIPAAGNKNLVEQWSIDGTIKTRLYIEEFGGFSGGFIWSINARWTGTVYTGDDAAKPAMILSLNDAGMFFSKKTTGAGTWTTWDFEFKLLPPVSSNDTTLRSDGVWQSGASAKHYASIRAKADSFILVSCCFMKRYPSTPSSFTFTLKGTVLNTPNTPSTFEPSVVGVSVFDSVTVAGNDSRFSYEVDVS